MGRIHSPKIVTSGLVGCWDAGNAVSYSGSGTTWNDLSGAANHATLVSSPTFANNSFTFNGTSYASTNLDVQPSAMTDTTFIAWVYATSMSGLQTVFTNDNGGYDRGLQSSRNDGKFNVFTGTASIAGPSFVTNVWQHVAVSYRSSAAWFYLNGVEYSIGACSGQATTNKFTIARNPSFGEAYVGSISFVMVYNRGLTLNEVRQNFTAHRGRFGV